MTGEMAYPRLWFFASLGLWLKEFVMQHMQLLQSANVREKIKGRL